MKRQQSSDEAEDESSRPSKTRRAREEQKLDLNATPGGTSEEDCEQGTEWTTENPCSRSDSSNAAQKSDQKDVFTHQPQQAADLPLGVEEDLDLLHSIWNAWCQQSFEILDEMLATLCEELAKVPACPPKYQFLTCFFVAKKLPVVFGLPKTVKVLLTFLDPNGPGSSLKKQNLLPVFSCRVLLRAFSEKKEWPLDFVKVYLEDAFSLRSWVDNESCKEFVANVITAFRDDDEDITMGADDVQGPSDATSKCDQTSSSQQRAVAVRNRYLSDDLRQKAKSEFLQALQQLLQAPSTKENPRVLFRLLTLGIGYEEVRVLASSMLEMWLNNPVHFRAAKALLDRIMRLTLGTSSSDCETVINLLSMRLSNLGVSQVKTSANTLSTDIVYQLVQKRSEYASLALKTFIAAEISSRVSQNMKGITTVLKALPDSLSPERELALVIKELALNENEEYGSLLQDTVSRVTKHLSSKDVSPFLLSRALLEPWPLIQEQQDTTKLSWFKKVIGLACLLLIQSAVPFASDDKFILAVSSGEHFQNESHSDQFKDFSTKMMKFQVEALTWCTEVLNVHLPHTYSRFFSASVRTLMFLEPPEEYHLPCPSGDIELNCFQLVAYSMHASEEILARVILMGISNQFPMLQEDALHIVERLVWRAAASEKHMFGTLSAESIQLPAAVVKLSSFNLLTLVRQPLPQVVLKDMFWRCCFVVVALAVFNPSSLGKSVWETFPAIKFLLEYLITEGAQQSSSENDSSEELEAFRSDAQAEETIEAFLKQELIGNDEALALNLNGDWKGNAMLQNNQRKPPKHVLEELGEIDKVHSLGRILRTCEMPSFVGAMASTQDFKQSRTWIKRILYKEPEIARMLPYDWQCKLLFILERSAHQEKNAASQLIQQFQEHLSKLMTEDGKSKEVLTVVQLLSQKLVSKSSSVRSSGRRCLSGILGRCTTQTAMEIDLPIGTDSSSEMSCMPWLEAIEKLKTANVVDVLVSSLQEALGNESCLSVIRTYLVFLERHLSVTSFAYTVSRLLLDRKILASSLMLTPSDEIVSGSTDEDGISIADLILKALSKTCGDGVHEWEDSHSPIAKLVSPPRTAVDIPGIVVEAMIESLALSSGSEACRHNDDYVQMVKFLFPGCMEADRDISIGDVSYIEVQGGRRLPVVSEEQAFHLLRSKDPRLVRAGNSSSQRTSKD